MNKHTMSKYASKDEMLAAVMAENRALHEQLEAIGAGGVEPLRKCAGLMQIQEPAKHAAVQQGVQSAEAVPDGFGTAQHWKEKAQYWANVAHELRGQALRGEPVDGITHPTQQGLDALTQAARSVLAERARQISAEGYTPEQDDGYNPGVLALHGGLYACHAFDNLAKKRAPEGWQWDEKWWKPKDPRSTLAKAGALILAEIERMDRSFAAQAKQGGV